MKVFGKLLVIWNSINITTTYGKQMNLCLTDKDKQNRFNDTVVKLDKAISTTYGFRANGDDKFFVEFKHDYLSITDEKTIIKKNIMSSFMIVH